MLSASAVLTRLEQRGLLEQAQTIASAVHVTPLDLASRSRMRPVVKARHTFWRWMRAALGWSYPSIAWLFGVNSSTVMYACGTRSSSILPPIVVEAEAC